MKEDLFAFWFIVGVFVTAHVVVTGRVLWWLLIAAAVASLIVAGMEGKDG